MIDIIQSSMLVGLLGIAELKNYMLVLNYETTKQKPNEGIMNERENK